MAGETKDLDVGAICRAVAEHLPGTWEVFPGDWSTYDRYIRTEEGGGRGLHVQQAAGTHRLCISGERGNPGEELGRHWPRPRRGQRKLTDEIGVGAKRPADQIARDIQRRLLPDYHAALAEAREAKAGHDAREAAEAGLAAELAGILDARVSTHFPGRFHFGAWGEAAHGTVHVSDDTVCFEVRVSGQLAAEVARCLAAVRAGSELGE